MGIGTVRAAKRIVLLAWGISKADILKSTIEGEVSSQVPATYLQEHSNTTFVLDSEASSELTRVKTPWLVKSCIWTEELKLKAVVWLSELTTKPILKLTDKDYNDNGTVGAIINFSINRFWVFKNQSGYSSHINSQLFKFALVVLGSISLKSFGTLIFQKLFQIDYRIGRLITDLFVSYGFNYPLIKYWVFRVKKNPNVIESN